MAVWIRQAVLAMIHDLLWSGGDKPRGMQVFKNPLDSLPI